jgi:hypothetical protein
MACNKALLWLNTSAINSFEGLGQTYQQVVLCNALLLHRQLQIFPSTPDLFLTVNSPDSASSAYQYSCNSLLAKPLSVVRLATRLLDVIVRLSHCSEHSAIEDFFRSWKLGINRYTRDQSTVLNLSLLINRPCLLCSLR